MAKVTAPPIRVKPALSKDFVGELRRQVNAAIVKAQAGIKPVRVKALIEPIGVSGRVPTSTTGGGGGGGQGGGRDSKVRTNANQALATSLEHVATAQLNLNKAFDQSIPLEQQAAAVTKVVTSLDNAQAAAEKTLAKAIVAKNATLQKAARRQLTDIQDFRNSIAGRVAATAAAPVIPPPAPSVSKAALRAQTKADEAAHLLTQSRSRSAGAAAIAAAEDDKIASARTLVSEKTAAATLAQRAYAAALKGGIPLQQVAAAEALRLAETEVLVAKEAEKAAITTAKAEATAARQAATLAKQQEAAARKQASLAASSNRAAARRSEQLSRGGQASLLSIAGIRGATLAASRSFLVGAAAITVFARAVRQFADLERNLDVFRATTAATADQMEAVRKEATALGADLQLPSVSAGDAAGAMVELAKAGLSVQDAIDGARGVLELATAAAIDNADAVRLVANVLNAFSLAGKQAATVADVLSNAANASQGSVADMGIAFQQAASAGHQVGLSFQDTAAFLTILAKNGLRGSDAGTSLRTALIRLVNPSKKAAEQLQKLGITLRDSAGNLRPDVFLQIAAATSKLGPAQRDATLALIGGQDAFRAVTILGRQSVESFLAMRAALRQEGTAAELAAARTRGLHGSLDGLQSVLETVGTTAAGHVGPALASFVRTVSSGITAFSQNEQVARTLQQTLTATGQAFNALGATIKGVGAIALPVASILSKVATSIGVGTILAGVVAWKSFNAILDGAILRMKILRPLIGGIATARIGASLATGFTTASIALEQFNKAANGSVKDTTAVKGFTRLTQVQKELAVASAASAVQMTTFGASLKNIGAGLVTSLITPMGIAVVGVTALAAVIFKLATDESAAERALKKFKSGISDLATAMGEARSALDSYNQSLRTISSAKQAVDQAKHAAAISRTAVATSKASTASAEYKSLLAAQAIARQDVTFAEEDYRKAVQDTRVQLELAGQAEDNLAKAREDAGQSAILLLNAEKISGSTLIPLNKRLEIQFLKRAQAAREENTADSLFLAKRLEALAKISEEVGAPSAHAIELLIETPNLKSALSGVARDFGITGAKANKDFVDSWILELSGRGAAKIQAGWNAAITSITQFFPDPSKDAADKGDKSGNAFAAAAAAAIRRDRSIAAAASQAFAAALAASVAQVTKLSTAEDLAVIASGSDTATLSVEQQKLAQASADRARAEARIAQLHAAGRNTGLDTAAKARADAIARQRAATEAIRGINETVAGKQKADADKLASQSAQNTQDFLNRFDKRRQQLENKVTLAGQTPGAADDIKANQILKKSFLTRIAAIKKRIRDMHLHGDALKIARDAIKGLVQDIFNTTNEINTLIKQQAEQRFADLLERADLRVQIAESGVTDTNKNTVALLRAHRAKLAAITKELVRVKNQYGKNSLEWLRVRAAQAAEIAAINQVTAEQKKKKDASASMEFAFLQAQSGFVANLLGNLIPGGATGGLVGGTTGTGTGAPPLLPPGATNVVFPGDRGPGGPSGGLSKSPADDLRKATVTVSGGPTRGGQSSQTQLLRRISHLLDLIYRGTGHPEAKHRQARNLRDMDLSNNI